MESFWTSIAGIGRSYSHITCRKKNSKSMIENADDCFYWFSHQLLHFLEWAEASLLLSFLGILYQKMPKSSKCSSKIHSSRISSKGQCFHQYSPLHSSHRLRFTFCLLDLLAGCCHQSKIGTGAGKQPAFWWWTNQEKVQAKNEN